MKEQNGINTPIDDIIHSSCLPFVFVHFVRNEGSMQGAGVSHMESIDCRRPYYFALLL